MVLQQAIVPKIPVGQAIKNWANIRNDLMENARKRKLQNDIIYSALQGF